jgi:enamine deaminase RidA (YjgF/YER057c/UK114 family)
MTNKVKANNEIWPDIKNLSAGEHSELLKMGIISEDGSMMPDPGHPEERPAIQKKVVHAPNVLNEAYDYFPRPSSFSRALSIDISGTRLMFISGTASVDEKGNTIHVGDFRAQCWRTFNNITQLLKGDGMTWHDVVRTSCYLRDIERDYKDFNEVRTAFYSWLQLNPLPASTGIQARICREDLLVEIEAIAVYPPSK